MTYANARVLVVDDEESIRSVLKQALVDDGHQVSVASSGQQALDALSQSDIEVMLLDIRMPGLSGLGVLSKAHNRWPDTSVIMVTAIGDVSTAVGAMKQGAYDYIAKPFNINEVMIAVHRALERRRLVLLDRQHQRVLEERLGEQEIRLREQFAELVQALGREHARLFSTNEVTKVGREKVITDLPPELQKPISLAAEFREALLRILGRAQL